MLKNLVSIILFSTWTTAAFASDNEISTPGFTKLTCKFTHRDGLVEEKTEPLSSGGATISFQKYTPLGIAVITGKYRFANYPGVFQLWGKIDYASSLSIPEEERQSIERHLDKPSANQPLSISLALYVPEHPANNTTCQPYGDCEYRRAYYWAPETLECKVE